MIEGVDDSQMRIPAHAMLFIYLFQPSRYMKHTAINLSGAVIFLIIWMTGASVVIDGQLNKQLFGQTMLPQPKTWGYLLGFGLGGGIIRGYVIYGLGGLWFRLRLWMCGVRGDVSWKKTGRVYMSAGIGKHLVWLGIIVYASLAFDDVDDYLQNEGSISTYISLVLIMLSQIWSSVTLYAGVRSVFNADRIWAIILYLVLPILTRLTALGILFALAFVGTAVNPQLDAPSQFADESFRFEYPSNWSVTADTYVPGPVAWVQIQPFVADAIIEFNIEYVAEDQNLIKAHLESITERWGMVFQDDFTQISSIGKFDGHGGRYTATVGGDKYIITILQTPIQKNADAVIMTIVEESVAEKVHTGFDHILKTMSINDPYMITPNLERTYTVETDGVQFVVPSNWWVQTQSEPETTNDDGTTNPPYSYAMIQTPGYGYFQLNIYGSGLSPRAELGVSLDDFTDTGRLGSEQQMDVFFGMDGFGVSGISPSTDGLTWQTQIHISTLPDDRFLELRSVYPEEHAEQYRASSSSNPHSSS